jgi:hypothetical protein
MMAGLSLKGFTPTLGKAVGMSAAAVYERQRALVRGGLLQVESGKASGSGVRLTGESLALLLVALLATDNLSRTEECTRTFANLKSIARRCPFTDEATFIAALSTILSSTDLSKRCRGVLVSRTGPSACIFYEKEKEPLASLFSLHGRKPKPQPFGMGVDAQLHGSTLREVASNFVAALEGVDKWEATSRAGWGDLPSRTSGEVFYVLAGDVDFLRAALHCLCQEKVSHYGLACGSVLVFKRRVAVAQTSRH